MKNIMGVIYTGESDERLRDLSQTRAIAALPVAGRYRIIDFLVSSMVNSGAKNIGIIMQKNYHSLMDHLGSGKEWDIHGKNEGLHVLPPFLTRENVGVYTGTLDALRSNIPFLSRSKQEYVVLSGSDIIYNAKLDEFVHAHIASNADITMVYTKNPGMIRDEYGTYLKVDEDGKVTDIETQPTHPHYENTFMEVFIMKRELLCELADSGVAHGNHHLTRDILLKGVTENSMRIMGQEYTGPCWRIDSVQSYFQFNMDILDTPTRKSLFNNESPIYTKVRDEMPVTYGDKAKVMNSLISDGCVIEGTVENSILFRGVRVAPDAHIKNCVIMQDGQVHSGAYIENCILDKQAIIKRNSRLIGPSSYPIVIGKNVVI
ncbi:MAG: glucose-1-phosphate adenylyltransferase subunit GlgD [Clostridia bacterium]|nr:glucose-1-phosphate adenylyltransferase subunit GlgD [Clostridia bacterium]